MRQDKKNTPIRPVAAAALSCMLAAALSGCSAAKPDIIKVQNAGLAEEITVTGKEETKVIPDMAQIRYGIYTRSETAAGMPGRKWKTAGSDHRDVKRSGGGGGIHSDLSLWSESYSRLGFR